MVDKEDIKNSPNDAEASSPRPGTKRKKLARTALTLREKSIVKSFCEQKVTDCKARGELVPSQEVLRREVETQFGWSCGRSTLSKIISMDWKLLRGSHEGGDAPRNPNMKRRRRPLFPAFEADLVKFILARVDEDGGSGTTGEMQAIENNGRMATVNDGDERRARPLTEALILEEAQRLKQVHGVSDEMLVLSVGWLARFKHRHCIRLRKPAGVSNKCILPVVGVSESSADSGSMGAWSASLMTPSLSQDVNEQSITRQLTTATIPGTNEDHMSSSHQSDNLELSSNSGSLPVLKRTALCSAQWCQDQSDKRLATTTALLEQIPESIRELACSCRGSAINDDFIGAIAGLRVAVVGFGSIVDAFLVAASVGANGFVICVEASPSSVYLAERLAESYCLRTLGLPAVNMKFIVGEYGGMPQSSSSGEDGEIKNLRGQADLVICNCSIQSLEFPASKNVMLELAFSLVKVGGELRVTDLVCSRRLSSSECEEAGFAFEASTESETTTQESSKQFEQKLLLGAPYVGDLRRLYRALSSDGEVRIVSCNDAEATAIDIAVAHLLPSLTSTNSVRFRRVTFRTFRIHDVEYPCEDYGQTAIFKGGEIGSRGGNTEPLQLSYRLDDDWNFQRGVCTPIDGNTAQILQTSWLKQCFLVSGDRSRHHGLFVASTPSVSSLDSSTPGGTLRSDGMMEEVNSQPSLTEPLEMVNI